MVGPTFGCLMADFRFGDQFWYENGGWPSSFILEQLTEIRKIKLSRLIWENTNEIDSIQVRMFEGPSSTFLHLNQPGFLFHFQVYAMVLPDHEINPRVPCKSAILPHIDLTKWRDASFHSAPGARPL